MEKQVNIMWHPERRIQSSLRQQHLPQQLHLHHLPQAQNQVRNKIGHKKATRLSQYTHERPGGFFYLYNSHCAVNVTFGILVLYSVDLACSLVVMYA